MHFSITHRTAYRYNSPVFLEPHLIRLRPREDAVQRLEQFALTVAPEPAGRSDYLDAEGNNVTQVWFDRAVNELAVSSSAQVETLRGNPYDFLLPPADQLRLKPSAANSPVARFASAVAADADLQTMPFLDHLAARLYSGWRHILRPDGAPLTGARSLETREGSCRDLAVLFCESCERVGLRARFVSGYEIAASGTDHPHMHAWAEVLIPGGGWRGYDPSRGIAVAANHVAVAAAVLPADAAPITGSYRGRATSKIDVAIQMQVR